MAARKVRDLCCVGGRYRRTLGKFINSSGKVAPKKFLLGTDRCEAELANVRLEQLWRDIEKYHKATLLPGEAMWDELTLSFAEAIRQGGRIRLQVDGADSETPGPAERYWWVRATYPSIADLLEDIESHPALVRSREAATVEAKFHAGVAESFAKIAARPAAAAAPGQTLYHALEAWGEWSRNRYSRGGEPTEAGRKVYEAAHRLKDCHEDIPLNQLTFSVAEAMADYWCSRPEAKGHGGKGRGKPISVVTVKNMLGYLKRFLSWLHRSEHYQWRDNDRIIEDATGRRRVRSLLTPEERKAEAAGPQAWKLEELVLLYRYATDRERLFILLGLNGGFAQSEIIHLAKNEVHLEMVPPQVQYIRHKSAKPGGFALWPETVRALRWNAVKRQKVEPKSNPWEVLTATGLPLNRQRISNAWNSLLGRVRRQHPDFPSRPFKVLRKTCADLIQGPGGGDAQVIAIMQARSKRTGHDDQADVYYNRSFDRVHAANMAVRSYLQPMFDAAPRAFTGQKRPRPGRRTVDEAKILQIAKLRAQGINQAEVAARVGVSIATVSRYQTADLGS